MSHWLVVRSIVHSHDGAGSFARSASTGPSRSRTRRLVSGPRLAWRAAIGPLVGILLALAAPLTASAANDLAPASTLYDVSFPECDGTYTPPSGALIVGVNGGRAYTQNRCFDRQLQWALDRGVTPDLYMNINYPKGPSVVWATNGPRGACASADEMCRAYNYGYNAAGYADRVASPRLANPRAWWLDVETANYWSPNQAANAQVIQGAIDYWNQHNKPVGIYSVNFMWQKIAGSYAPGLPNWVAQVNAAIPAMSYCSSGFAFGGGTVAMVQSWDGHHDIDYSCGGAPAAPPSQPASPPNNSPNGTLVGSTGGSSAFYTFDYWGGNRNETVTVDFSPRGPDTTNGFFVILWQHGVQLAKIRASDFRTPGQISMNFSSATSGPMTVQLVNYNDPKATPPIT